MAREYGNGLRLAPHARLDDGRLEAAVVDDRGALARLWSGPSSCARQRRGGPEASRGAQSSAPQIEAVEGPLTYHLDGEPIVGEGRARDPSPPIRVAGEGSSTRSDMSSSEALVDAAKAGDLSKVRELIRSSPGLAPARLPSGESPVMAALYRGHREIVDVLVESIGSGGHLRGRRARTARRSPRGARAAGRRQRVRLRRLDAAAPRRVLRPDQSGRAPSGCRRQRAGDLRQLAPQHAAARRNRRWPRRFGTAVDRARRRRHGAGRREAHAAAHCRREWPDGRRRKPSSRAARIRWRWTPTIRRRCRVPPRRTVTRSSTC